MKRLRTPSLVAVVIVVVAVAAISYKLGQMRAGPGGEKAGKKTLYQCPMHPEYISDRPGSCPICGMDLVPIEQEEAAADKEKKKEREELVKGLTTVHLDDMKRQLIAVTTVPVEKRTIEKEIRAVGIVRADETRVATVTTKVRGWIEKLYVDFEGAPIRAGQPMLTIYSPELVQTQEEYLRALEAQRQFADSKYEEVREAGRQLVAAAERRLRLWDIPEADIRRLRQTGKVRRTMTLYAPVSGIVVKKMAFAGMEVKPGQPLYQVAELSRVWVEAEFYEQDLAEVRPGLPVRIRFEAYPGKVWEGTIEYVYPYMEGQTRTLKARISLPNPDLKIKPDMYAQVEAKVPLGTRLVIPRDATVQTGERTVVFVEVDKGVYEPREVQLGERSGDYYVVLAGLSEGERVVERGLFMIDSESRLRAKISGRSQKQGQGEQAMPAGHQHQ